MIAYLKGQILFFTEHGLVLTTAAGVGYEVFLPARLSSQLQTGQEVELYTYTVVREDVLDLYGFLSWAQRNTFSVLLTIPKVGPKLALAILDVFGPDKLQQIVTQEDASLLATVPGIGTKTAKKILLDLKDKLKIPSSSEVKNTGNNSVVQDALEALKNLGYASAEVEPLLTEIIQKEPECDVSMLIREVLRQKVKTQ
ncbi:MAG: Holliday junction branch migration protein RuvA [Desulfonauticus sp.]|nr:Holliday junction branch migration protein RuvA [Desulfonauticus sp.]